MTMLPLMTVVVVVVMLATCLSVQGYNDGSALERYSKMKLLITCLGEETMARWRQQMVSAGNECQEGPLIPGLLHQIHTVTQRQPYPSNPFTNVHYLQPQFRPSDLQVQQQLQQNAYLQQQQQQQQQHQYQNPFYQRQPQQLSPVSQEQHYIISSSNNNPAHPPPFSSVVFPQPSYYKPTVFPIKNWPIYQQGFTFTPSLPGKLAPTIQYITAPTLVDLQKLSSQPVNSKYQGTPASGQGDASLQVVRQQDTYTNPYITVEQTEAFQQQKQQQQQQQQQGQGAGVTRVTGEGPLGISSFHQQYPFAPPQQENFPVRRLNKREAEARWPVHGAGGHVRHVPRPETQAEAGQDSRLRAIQSRVSDKISNMTCVLRSMKMLTPELEPDLSFMETSLLELPISHELFEELKMGMQYCRQASLCHPRRSQLYDIPITREFSSSLEFFRCFGKEKLRACLKSDLSAMEKVLGFQRYGPEPAPASSFNDALQDVDDLLNGGSGNLVDLALM